jgi:hypothetical protein
MQEDTPQHDPATPDNPKKPKTRKRIWQKAFLACLSVCGNVTDTCRKLDVDPSTVYDHKKADPEFARLWEEALDKAMDCLEIEAHRRAKAGSDRLLEFLLKCRRKDKYGDNPVTQSQGQQPQITIEKAPDEPDQQA